MFQDYSQNPNLPENSEAIRPDKKNPDSHTDYRDIGSMKLFEKEKEGFHFHCDNGRVFLRFYNQETLRVSMGENPGKKRSFACVASPEKVSVDVKEKEEEIILSGGKIQVRVQKSPFRLTIYDRTGNLLLSEGERGMGWKGKGEVLCFKERKEEDHFYGFGERTGFLDKREDKITLWNSDVYAPHNPEINSLYLSIPFFLSLNKGKSYGIFFDNTYRTDFDLKSDTHSFSFGADGGELDYYFFVGPSPKKVVSQYTHLTGRMHLPPKWALGYHQSRYSYSHRREVEEVARLFREKEIPCDALYLDIHYMEAFSSFSFDRDRFPHPKEMVEGLSRQGFHIVPIVDPGIPADPESMIYREGVQQQYFCRFIEGELFQGEVWPGISVFPDFTSQKVRNWWGSLHGFYTDMGIQGIWMDMNEPAVFNETKTMDLQVLHDNDGDPLTHRALHNVYGFLMAEATYEGMKKLLKGKRPFLLTRAGYSGIQRYSGVWTGDNRSFWEHMAMSIPMCLNLGLSGVAFSGADVGGFAHDATGELLARWMQLGAFLPFFRNHSALGTQRQEPWSFGGEIEEVIRKYIRLRYEWMPHLYSLFWETTKTGVPVIRPLFMEEPEDENTYNLSDSFLLGGTILIAPILSPGVTYRAVYLPAGKWFDYWSDEIFIGGKAMLAEAGIERIPLFIKEGTLFPCGSMKNSTKEKDQVLKFHVFAKNDGYFCYTLYEDDGETFSYQSGIYYEMEIRCTFSPSSILLETIKKNTAHQPSWDEIQWVCHGLPSHGEIILNGEKIPQSQIARDERGRTIFQVNEGFL